MPILILIGVAAALIYFKGEDTLNTVVQNSSSWEKYDSKFKYYASQNGLPSEGWLWLKAICLNESSLGENPLVKAGLWSTDGLSRGIMQLTVATANDYMHWYAGKISDLKKENPAEYKRLAYLLDDDDLSIQISAKHFSRLYRKFRVLEHAVKAYNQGEGNMAKEIALRASRGIAASGVKIAEYPQAANYWSRFEKNLARTEGK